MVVRTVSGATRRTSRQAGRIFVGGGREDGLLDGLAPIHDRFEQVEKE